MVNTVRATRDAPEGELMAKQSQDQPLPTVVLAEPHTGPRATKYVCLDVETNGFPGKTGAPREDWALHWSSYPIQLSVDFVEHGEVTHAMDAVIRGATQLSPWVRKNVPVTLKDLEERGVDFKEGVKQLADMLRDGDMIVARNAQFDLETVLARTVEQHCITWTSPRRAQYWRLPGSAPCAVHTTGRHLANYPTCADSVTLTGVVGGRARRQSRLSGPGALCR